MSVWRRLPTRYNKLNALSLQGPAPSTKSKLCSNSDQNPLCSISIWYCALYWQLATKSAPFKALLFIRCTIVCLFACAAINPEHFWIGNIWIDIWSCKDFLFSFQNFCFHFILLWSLETFEFWIGVSVIWSKVIDKSPTVRDTNASIFFYTHRTSPCTPALGDFIIHISFFIPTNSTRVSFEKDKDKSQVKHFSYCCFFHCLQQLMISIWGTRWEDLYTKQRHFLHDTTQKSSPEKKFRTNQSLQPLVKSAFLPHSRV